MDIKTQQFINKAIAIHGNRYDYSKFKYVTVRTKSTIICSIHGDFEQTPDSHLQGSNCRKCANVYIPSSKEFVEKASLIHKNKYSYNNIDYINNRTKITITCPLHGDFKQSPDHHIQGSGCPKCVGRNKSNNEFILQSKRIHSDSDYDYSKSTYINCSTKLTVTCKSHGDFFVTPDNHLKGHGCKKCGIQKITTANKSDLVSFVEKALIVPEHQGKGYSYTKSEYKGTHRKITITCPIHDDFQQQPANHLLGNGCPSCAYTIRISKPEQEIFDFVSQFANDAVQSDRTVLGLKELDIMIHSLKIAIEYNGLIMHSELYGREKSYHHKKSKISNSKGFKLIHIWGDEWREKREWCENYIKKILGVPNKVIYARKCDTKYISIKEARPFLEQYHLQGSAGHKAYGFFHEGELVAVATTRKMTNGNTELARWCVKFGITVHGGLSKVAKHLPFDISYCDTAKFDGYGYKAAGMKLLKTSQPSYWYTNGYERKSRIHFQKHKLLQNPKAKGDTEKELANSLGWYAIGGLPQLVFGWE